MNWDILMDDTENIKYSAAEKSTRGPDRPKWNKEVGITEKQKKTKQAVVAWFKRYPMELTSHTSIG